MSSSSSSPTADPELGRLANLLGAWSVAVSDRITAAAEAAAGRGGQAPAALVSLEQFAEGSTIEQLSAVLGLTHSATVRLVDALVADGHVARRRRRGDGRAVSIRLTASGRAAARRIGRGRSQAVQDVLGRLTDRQRRALTAMAELLTGEVAALRLEQRAEGEVPTGGWLCRLCDFGVCGRPEGRCPAAVRAHAYLA